LQCTLLERGSRRGVGTSTVHLTPVLAEASNFHCCEFVLCRVCVSCVVVYYYCAADCPGGSGRLISVSGGLEHNRLTLPLLCLEFSFLAARLPSDSIRVLVPCTTYSTDISPFMSTGTVCISIVYTVLLSSVLQ
jgi:hypothetical protein